MKKKSEAKNESLQQFCCYGSMLRAGGMASAKVLGQEGEMEQ